MAATPAERRGTVICHPSGERWTAEVWLEEGGERLRPRHRISLNRTFATEDAARRAGEQVVAGWKEGRVPLRELLLKELAAAYRALRETYKTMQPPTVPTTRSAWEQAIDRWAQLGWIEAADAARYRDHVQLAFETEAGPVRRHRLAVDADAAG